MFVKSQSSFTLGKLCVVLRERLREREDSKTIIQINSMGDPDLELSLANPLLLRPIFENSSFR